MEINRCSGCMSEIEAYPCPHCGFNPAEKPQPDHALPYNSVLNGKYLVGRVLGQGGFGITYLGYDLTLGLLVAIKEFYPNGHVFRSSEDSRSTIRWGKTDNTVVIREKGIESIQKEARKMAKIRTLPEIVTVHETFLQNDTAYLVMDYVEGETLKAILQREGPMPWEKAKDVFLPVIRAMAEVHKTGMVHRDISPDNLMITPDGQVRILDLGAAKDVAAAQSADGATPASSQMVIKAGFSPLEQYSNNGATDARTDVYATAASLYYTITGVCVPAATDRMMNDTLDWNGPDVKTMPKTVREALRHALAVLPEKRTVSMEEFLAELTGRKKTGGKGKKTGIILGAAAALVLIGVLAAVFLRGPGSTAQDAAPAADAAGHDPLLVSREQPETYENVKTVFLGSYEQDNNPLNGREAIEWIVLAEEDGRTLLLSKFGLDAKPYNTENTAVTWETCSLRQWLNGEFLQSAFTEGERKLIVPAVNKNPDNSNTGAPGGNDTEDKVFLLSAEESGLYITSPEIRKNYPTAYARAQGVYADESGVSWGWLRSPGWETYAAGDVDLEGELHIDGGVVDDTSNATRPAIWVTFPAAEKPAEAPQAGEVLFFGSFEQDDNEANGAEPLEWLVLDYDAAEGAATLLSRYALLAGQFHAEGPYPGWAKSDLRTFMNDTFLNAAFSKAEQENMLLTETITPARNGFSGGDAVYDYVRVMSVEETEALLPDLSSRVTAATPYAARFGAVQADGMWPWTRSPGLNADSACAVGPEGEIGEAGCVYYSDGAYRPVIRVKVQPQ